MSWWSCGPLLKKVCVKPCTDWFRDETRNRHSLGGHHLISRKVGGGGAGILGWTKIFFQYIPAHGYFFPAVWLTNHLFQPLLEGLS